MGGLKYVDEFEFPTDAGFTGSAGQTHVKGYARGGHVKAVEPAAAPKAKTAKPSQMSPAQRVHAPPMHKAEGGLAVKRRGVPVASAKPIIERTPPKPMAMSRPSAEAGDTDARVGRGMSDKRVMPGRDSYAHGGKVVKKGLGGAVLPALFGLAGLLASKKKKKGGDEGPPPPINAVQALAARMPAATETAPTDDPKQSAMRKGGRVKC